MIMNMKGFTLIETLVAIAIITIAIVGPMYAANRAIVVAEIAQEQLTASYLAQEGIEYVRSMRDDAYLAAVESNDPNASVDAWNDFLTGNSAWSIKQCNKKNPKNACTLDPFQLMGVPPNGNSLDPCNAPPHTPPSGNDCTPLYLNTSNNTYTQQVTPNPTPYTRWIDVNDIPSNPNEEIVDSTVTWNFHGGSYSVTVTDDLTPWQ